MLDRALEVRLPLGDGRSYRTDLDVETLKRAGGLYRPADDGAGPKVG